MGGRFLANFIFLLSLLLFSCRSYAQNIALVRNGQTKYIIIIPEKATKIEKKAATELQHYLYLISGVKLLIMPEGNHPQQDEILIGKTKNSRIISYTKLEEDGIAIKTQGEKLFLTGGNRKGVLYSVYTFLEDYLGCRKYTKDLSYIPKKNTILIAPINRLENPAFKFRSTFFIDALDTAYADWHKLNYFFEGWGSFAHTFQTLLPTNVYFKSHPEYFALVDGRRTTSQPCLSNPDVLKIVIENLRKEIIAKPDSKYWSVSQNDNWDYCHCPLCEPKNLKENGYQGTLLPFVNEVAKHFPNKIIGTLAFNQSMYPPNAILPSKNVEIMLCPSLIDRGKPIISDQSQYTIGFKNSLNKWEKLTPNLFIWDYIANYSNSVCPYPNIETLQPNIQFFKTHHVPMLFEQGNGNQIGDFSELKCYLVSELMWNPNIDVRKAMNEFIDAFYGPAGGEIRNYISFRESEFRKSGKSLNPWGNPTDDKDGYLSTQDIEKYHNIFKEAEQLTANSPTYFKHVVQERLGIDFAELEIANNDPERAQLLNKAEGAKNRLNKFLEDCTRFGINSLTEAGKTPLEFLKDSRLNH